MKKEQTKSPERAHMIRNTAFALKCGFRSAPASLILLWVSRIVGTLCFDIVTSVFLLKTALSILESGAGYQKFVLSICSMIALKLLSDLQENFIYYCVRIHFEIKCECFINHLIFDKAQQTDLSHFEDPDFFDKYTRATYVISKGGYKDVIHGFTWLIANLTGFISLAVYLVTVDKYMLLFILTPVLSFFFKNRKNRIEFKREKETTVYERRKDYVRRTVLLKDFAKDLKITGIFSVLKRNFEEAVAKNIEIAKKYGASVLTEELLSVFFASIVPTVGAFIYVCFRLLVTKSIRISDFSVMIAAVTNCRGRMNQISDSFSSIHSSCFYVQSLREFLAVENTVKSGSRIPDDFESLTFQNVSFRYEGSEKYALKDVSFTLKKGETTAIVGFNGAGKTTLSKLLMRLYDVTDGAILYNGVNIKEFDLQRYREKFASVFQDYKLFAMTAAENVLMREVDGENLKIAEKAVRIGGVGEKIDSLPNGIHTVLTREFDETGALLSGGEAQKLAVARLFARDFAVAVLDEPSSALDPIADDQMFRSLHEGTRGKCVVFISHRLSCAVAADNILVFADGALIEQGDHEALMQNGGTYRKMFDLQSSGYKSGLQNRQSEAPDTKYED